METIIIKNISTVGTCVCPECNGEIHAYLRNLYNNDQIKKNYVYKGYLDHIYSFNGKLSLKCTNPKLCNGRCKSSKYAKVI